MGRDSAFAVTTGSGGGLATGTGGGGTFATGAGKGEAGALVTSVEGVTD